MSLPKVEKERDSRDLEKVPSRWKDYDVHYKVLPGENRIFKI